MITPRLDIAPEAQGRHQANPVSSCRQLSSGAWYGHQRARGGRGAIANPRRKASQPASGVRLASCERQDVNGHDADDLARGAVDKVATDLAAFANSPILSSRGAARLMAVLFAIRIGRNHYVGLRHCEGGGDHLFGCHLGNSRFVHPHIGPLALTVNGYFA